MKSDSPKVLIIGSGLAGLVAAYELAERGLAVTIIEAAHYAGGRTTSWVDRGGRILDTGAHVVADHYVNLLDVLSRVGAAGRLVWFNEQLFLRRGFPPVRWRLTSAPPPLHMLNVAARLRLNPWTYFKLALAAFDLTSYPEGELKQLDRLTYADWQRSYLGDKFLDIGDAAAEAACFLPADQVSAHVVFSWIRAMARNGQASNVASFDGPFHEALTGPIIRAIEARGGCLLPNTALIRLEHDEHRVKAAVLRPSECAGPFHSPNGKPPLVPHAPENRVECDYLISAMPVQAFQAIAAEEFLAVSGLQNTKSLTTVPAVGLTIWLDRSVQSPPRCTPLCSGLAMRGFMDFSSVKRASPEEPSVFQFVLSKAPARARQTDDEILEQVAADIRDVWPPFRDAQIADYALERVGAAMHASVVGAFANRPAAATRLRNFFIAGDWAKHEVKPSMEGAAISGRYAANGVLMAVGERPVPVLTPPEGSFTIAARKMRGLIF